MVHKDNEFWYKESSGGSMGSHLLIMRGTRYVGHFYPNATKSQDIDDLLELLGGARGN